MTGGWAKRLLLCIALAVCTVLAVGHIAGRAREPGRRRDAEARRAPLQIMAVSDLEAAASYDQYARQARRLGLKIGRRRA
jgi:hypothetical protein